MRVRRRLRLAVDPIACDGRGLCAELLPEAVALDDWGYPIIDRRALPQGLVGPARRAVRACPTLALRLEEIEESEEAGEASGAVSPGHGGARATPGQTSGQTSGRIWPGRGA